MSLLGNLGSNEPQSPGLPNSPRRPAVIWIVIAHLVRVGRALVALIAGYFFVFFCYLRYVAGTYGLTFRESGERVVVPNAIYYCRVGWIDSCLARIFSPAVAAVDDILPMQYLPANATEYQGYGNSGWSLIMDACPFWACLLLVMFLTITLPTVCRSLSRLSRSCHSQSQRAANEP